MANLIRHLILSTDNQCRMRSRVKPGMTGQCIMTHLLLIFKLKRYEKANNTDNCYFIYKSGWLCTEEIHHNKSYYKIENPDIMEQINDNDYWLFRNDKPVKFR